MASEDVPLVHVLHVLPQRGDSFHLWDFFPFFGNIRDPVLLLVRALLVDRDVVVILGSKISFIAYFIQA